MTSAGGPAVTVPGAARGPEAAAEAVTQTDSDAVPQFPSSVTVGDRARVLRQRASGSLRDALVRQTVSDTDKNS
jgi:hypothetical protein